MLISPPRAVAIAALARRRLVGGGNNDYSPLFITLSTRRRVNLSDSAELVAGHQGRGFSNLLVAS